MPQPLNLLKLSVGSTAVDDLAEWQETVIARNRAAGLGGIVTHTTRMWPRQEARLRAGGSIYWVIRGSIACRQQILDLAPREGADGIRRCALILDPQLYRTRPQPRRAFQGWRYLEPTDAPADAGAFTPGAPGLPAELEQELQALGVL